MAENGKTKLIITIVIGLFGVMCFGFALTVTDKYKTERRKAVNLERKFEAGKNELIKIPELKEKVIKAEDEAKAAKDELASVQEELEETSGQLDEVTGELESLKSEREEGVVAEGETGEAAEEGEEKETADGLENANEKIASLTEENESLRDKVSSAESAISDLRSSESGSKAVGFTFNGLYNIDPMTKKQAADEKLICRGLAYHRTRESSRDVESVTDKKDPKQLVEEHIDIIDARISELLTYASAKKIRRDRIGVNAYVSGASQMSQEEQAKITNALNDVLANYTDIYKVISDCGLYTSWERGLAKSALNKRLSNYIGHLLAKNQSGKFSNDDQDVKLLLSKIQNEQKYFLN